MYKFKEFWNVEYSKELREWKDFLEKEMYHWNFENFDTNFWKMPSWYLYVLNDLHENINSLEELKELYDEDLDIWYKQIILRKYVDFKILPWYKFNYSVVDDYILDIILCIFNEHWEKFIDDAAYDYAYDMLDSKIWRLIKIMYSLYIKDELSWFFDLLNVK